MRSEKEINKYLEESECRVSWMRKTTLLNRIVNGLDLVPAGYPATQEAWNQKRLELLDQGFKSILEKVQIDTSDPLDGRSYEYWEGIMAALRWVCGDEKDFLDT